MRMITRTLAGAALAIGLGLSVPVGPVSPPSQGSVPLLSLGVSQAEAQTYRAHTRRVARRTARRTSARQSHISTLPGGCVLRGVYHYCGGGYYQPEVQGGATG